MGENLEKSTYMHDFLWPCPKNDEPKRTEACGETPCCLCHGEEGLDVDKSRQYSETQSEATPCSGSSLFLRKINEKYPYLYNVLRMSPEDALVARVYADRTKSTYQVDYNKSGEHPTDEYTKLVPPEAPARDPCYDKYNPPAQSKKAPCNLCGVPVNSAASAGNGSATCDPRNIRPIAFRPAVISKRGFMKTTGSNKPANPKTSGVMAVTTYGISEYMDSVSRNGTNIIKNKLHVRSAAKE